MTGETDTVADVRPPSDKHVGRCYAWKVEEKTTIIEGASYFNFSSEVLKRISSQM